MDEMMMAMMGGVYLQGVCPFCGKSWEVGVYELDYYSYENGASAQEAFPYLSLTDREKLISRLCARCQDMVFREE